MQVVGWKFAQPQNAEDFYIHSSVAVKTDAIVKASVKVQTRSSVRVQTEETVTERTSVEVQTDECAITSAHVPAYHWILLI